MEYEPQVWDAVETAAVALGVNASDDAVTAAAETLAAAHGIPAARAGRLIEGHLCLMAASDYDDDARLARDYGR